MHRPALPLSRPLQPPGLCSHSSVCTLRLYSLTTSWNPTSYILLIVSIPRSVKQCDSKCGLWTTGPDERSRETGNECSETLQQFNTVMKSKQIKPVNFLTQQYPKYQSNKLNSKQNRRKKNNRVEINYHRIEKTEKINEMKTGSSKKINKIDQNLARVMKNKKNSNYYNPGMRRATLLLTLWK